MPAGPLIPRRARKRQQSQSYLLLNLLMLELIEGLRRSRSSERIIELPGHFRNLQSSWKSTSSEQRIAQFEKRFREMILCLEKGSWNSKTLLFLVAAVVIGRTNFPHECLSRYQLQVISWCRWCNPLAINYREITSTPTLITQIHLKLVGALEWRKMLFCSRQNWRHPNN